MGGSFIAGLIGGFGQSTLQAEQKKSEENLRRSNARVAIFQNILQNTTPKYPGDPDYAAIIQEALKGLSATGEEPSKAGLRDVYGKRGKQQPKSQGVLDKLIEMVGKYSGPSQQQGQGQQRQTPGGQPGQAAPQQPQPQGQQPPGEERKLNLPFGVVPFSPSARATPPQLSIPPRPAPGTAQTQGQGLSYPPMGGYITEAGMRMVQEQQRQAEEQARLTSQEKREQERDEERRQEHAETVELRNRELEAKIKDAEEKASDRKMAEADRAAYQKESLDLKRMQIENMMALREMAMQQRQEAKPLTPAKAADVKSAKGNAESLIKSIDAVLQVDPKNPDAPPKATVLRSAFGSTRASISGTRFGRVAKMAGLGPSAEETSVETAMQRLPEQVNIFRKAYSATGFRGPQGWEALQSLVGKYSQDPDLTVQVLQAAKDDAQRFIQEADESLAVGQGRKTSGIRDLGVIR